MGTSSTLFNGGLLRLEAMNDTNIITAALKAILEDLGRGRTDVSQIPNPFYGWTAQPNPASRACSCAASR